MISNQPLLFYGKGTRAWGQLEATVRRSQCGGHSAAHCWLAHVSHLADSHSQNTVFSLASPAGLRTETEEVSMGRPSVCEFFSSHASWVTLTFPGALQARRVEAIQGGSRYSCVRHTGVHQGEGGTTSSSSSAAAPQQPLSASSLSLASYQHYLGAFILK